ncbi:YjjW family glycine radical enzyme activase [Vibrio sp. JC009]|uniref:YjjW family glycine radical enzyme activase n=1 Tax=Vibrio sp. JC009 TaxID=2912314 RepID=UPI0023B00DF4|nr:YjjW family glycine radical enzyme activase [Vibrio sp. JC009]WED23985.1 YjjW family glycine radical enzyme activase [Vibrio sp. JC009]
MSDVKKPANRYNAKVSKILTFSCVDGPGNRLVIFLQGCNFSCVNCHNPHTINHCNHCGICVPYCPDGALTFTPERKVLWDAAKCTQCDKCTDICSFQASPKVTEYSVAGLLEVIRDNHLFIDGITVTGGEATLELPFVSALFSEIKNDSELKHLSCFVDSNGSLSTQGWKKIASVMDGAMVDLKAWQSETHEWLTGRDNHRVFKSLEYLAEQRKLYEIRLLLIPGQTDLEQEVESLGKYLSALPTDVQIRINAFQHHGVTGEALLWDKCSKEQTVSFQQALEKSSGRKVVIPSVFL